MKVLTLKEPWASLIAIGIKTIETRSWKTNYRGEIYIHTGLTEVQTPKEVENDYNKSNSRPGYIVAKCNLTDCICMDEKYINQVKETDIKNYVCGSFEVGRYAWILEDAEIITPIPARGRLSIWNYNPE